MPMESLVQPLLLQKTDDDDMKPKQTTELSSQRVNGVYVCKLFSTDSFRMLIHHLIVSCNQEQLYSRMDDEGTSGV